LQVPNALTINGYMSTNNVPDSPPAQAPTRYIVTLQALRAAPLRAAALVDGLPEAAHHAQPASGSWAIHQILAHLSAGEAPFLARLRRIVADDNPFLPYFGPDVARPDSPETLPALLEKFRAEREVMLQFLAGLGADDWDRPGVHETMGPTTLALQLQNIANHDAEHLAELHSLRDAWDAGVHDHA
jgi:uncharacterized damage-inducible protein DinB